MAEAPVIAISDITFHQVVVRNEEPELYDTHGRLIRPSNRRLVAQFSPGGCPEWALEQARARFEFRGMYEGQSIEQRIGVFDSAIAAEQQHWTEDEHALVVRRLREQNPGWTIVEEPRVQAPWPSYDKLVAQGQRTADKVAARNLELAAETGKPVEWLIAYERQNRNDQRILAAYQEARDQDEPELEPGELVEA